MKKYPWLWSVAAAGALLTGDALAVGQAGLWNSSLTINLVGVAMPQMPPEALAQMRALGMSIPGMPGSAPIQSQVCISAAQAASTSPPPMQQGCQNQNVNVTGNTATGQIVCTGELTGTGTFSFTQMSATQMSNNFTFQGTRGGQPANFTANAVMTYVGADCGTVQPYAP
jgi:hypothetical protein